MSKERGTHGPRFWLPFAAWSMIFVLVSTATTLTADFHMLWGEYPWTDPFDTFRGENILISWITDVWFILPLSINTAIYMALLFIALAPFIKRSKHRSALPVLLCAVAALSIVMAHAASRLLQGILVHFAFINPSSENGYIAIEQEWWTFPRSTIVVEISTAVATMILLTTTLLFLKNRTHLFRCFAIFGQWASFVLTSTYAAWWSFDVAVNESPSIFDPWNNPASTFLNVFDPWNYHHNGLVYAVHALVYFTGFRLLLRRLIERRKLWLNNHCVCGYDITGISSVCPECGTEISRQTA